LSSCLLSKNIKIKIYKTIILPDVLYGHEAWSLTLRVLEKRVLRKIFASNRDEVIGGWRKLHTRHCHSLYSSPNIKVMIKMRNVYTILVGKPEGKRPLRRPRQWWEDNIKMNLRKISLGVWTEFIWARIGTGGRLL
jgi:hypothetical protein